jgi:outer membrane protein assembly factor BamB
MVITTRAALAMLGLAGSMMAGGSAGAATMHPETAHYGFDRPTAIAAGDGHLWIANTGGNSVTETTYQGSLVRTLHAARYGFHTPDAIAVSGSHVFVLNRRGSVTEVSATDGSLVRIIHGAGYEFARPVAMAVQAGVVWVVNRASSALTEFRTSNGSLVRVLRHGADLNRPVAIAAGGNRIWVVNSTGASTANADAGSVSVINATTGRLVRNVHAPADGLQTPRGIAFDGTHLWITDTDPGTLTELTASGALVQLVTDTSARNVYLEQGTVVAAHAGQVYVISPPGASPMVSRIVAATAKGMWFECNTNTPDPQFVNPAGLAVQGHHVWVVSPGNNSLAELHVSTGLLVHRFG